MEKEKIKKRNNKKTAIGLPGKILEWFDYFLSIRMKYGWRELIRGAIYIFVVVSLGTIMYNMKDINPIEMMRVLKKQEEVHLSIRSQVSLMVQKELTKLLIEVEATRASIVEFHNGRENATDLPFVYGDFTYEEVCSDTIAEVGPDFENLPLSRYKAPTYLMEHRYFIGKIEDFSEIDYKMACRIVPDGTKYLMIGTISNRDTDIGLLIVSFNYVPDYTTRQLYEIMMKYIAIFSIQLDLATHN